MFINTIVRKTSVIKSSRNVAKDMPYVYDIILYYGFNSIRNKVFENKDYLFDKEDEYGKYYESYGGGRDNYKCEDFKKIKRDGKVVGIKFYQHEKKFGVSNLWTDCCTTNSEYPCHKPFKLLERIIKMGSV